MHSSLPEITWGVVNVSEQRCAVIRKATEQTQNTVVLHSDSTYLYHPQWNPRFQLQSLQLNQQLTVN